MNWKHDVITLAIFSQLSLPLILTPAIGSILLGAGIVFERIFWARLLKRARAR